MKQRNIAAVMLLGLCTFGVYDLFWLYNTRQEMTTKGAKIPPFILLLAPSLAMLAGIVLGFASLGVNGVNDINGDADSATIVTAAVVVGIAALGSIPVSLYWMYKYCVAVQDVTQRHLETGLSYSLWIVLALFGFPFVWYGIVQDAFNKVAATVTLEPAANPTPAVTPPTPPPDQPTAA